jgi:glycosyltransferase involved in cell wall biosynthesis
VNNVKMAKFTKDLIMYQGKSIGVVIPALNEEQAIGNVLGDLFAMKNELSLPSIDQIVVCDNGSTDNTSQIATSLGAKVIAQPVGGYGIACLTAIDALDQCDIVLFVDADDSCYVDQAQDLFDAILDGADLAIGSRTLGKEEKGALTPLQKFGNGLSSFLIRLLWQHPISDLGPFRAIRYPVLKHLKMQDRAFGWTVEMQVKTIQLGYKTQEVAVDSKVRIGQSKISGALRGSIGAGYGILSMIAKLRWQQKSFRETHRSTNVYSR